MLVAKAEKIMYTSFRRNNLFRQKLIILSLFLSISLFLQNISFAATYYLDANGTTGGSGTYEDPYHRQGSGVMGVGSSGDTVYLRNGYYGEINTSASLNADYITIQAQPGHKPGFKRIRLTSGAKWVFKGLNISPSLAPVYAPPDALVYIGNACNLITIEDCNIYSVQDASSWNLSDWESWRGACNYAVDIRGPNTTIRGITVKNVYYGITAVVDSADNITIEYSTIEHFSADGIVICCDNPTIQYNTIKNSYKIDGTHTDAIQFHRGPDTSTPIYDANIVGNLVLNKAPGRYDNGIGVLMDGIVNYDVPPINWYVANNIVAIDTYNGLCFNSLENSLVINNIVVDMNPSDGMNTWIGGAFCVSGIIRNNIAKAFAFTGTVSQDHNIDIDTHGYDSLFVDWQNHDFRQKLGSPAIDAGSPVSAPDIDITGTPRPQGLGFDIGAYEYISGSPDTTPPFTPQNLTAQAISESQINLSWQESTDPESSISYYKIYRNGNQIDTSTNNSYSDTDLSPETTYTYEVTAVNGKNLESGKSDPVQATTLAAPSDTTPPSIVSVNASEIYVEVLFNEFLNQATAENISNYAINNGISIISVSPNSEHNGVILSTSSHTEDTIYTLTVTGVEDTAGNAMPETSIEYRYDTGLVGLWRFDEGGGNTAEDSSGHGNTGTLINGPTWTTGRINSALSFDGIDDAVEISTVDFDKDKGTVALWVYFKSLSGVQYIFGHTIGTWDNRIQLYSDNGSLSLGLGDSHTVRTSIQNLALQTWYHIALAWDGTSYVVYVDGVAKANGSYTALTVLNNFADVGNDGNTSYRNEAFNGLIDEVRIYNRALDADEVLSHFNEAGSLVFEPIGDKQVDAGSTLTFEVITQDPDQQVFIEADPDLPFDPDIVFINKVFSWSTTSDDVGSYEVTFIAPQGQYEDFETITITVNSVKINQAPVLGAIGNKSVSEGSNLSFSVNATDPDGDTVTYSVQNLPSGATFSGSTFSWTPASGQAGSYQVTFIASDGQLQDSETITITVTSAGPSLSDNLVGYWKMNDNASNTTVVDNSGKGNNGVARRNTSGLTTAGKVNGALTFNGSTDYINCGSNSSLNLTNAISVGVWVKFDILGVDQGIVDKGNSLTDGVIRLWLWHGNNEVFFDAPEGVVRIYGAPSGGFSTGRWYNIVASYDRNGGANNLNLYIDGVKVASLTKTAAMGTNSYNLTIGARRQGKSDFFDGAVDNVMIFNRALSQQEIGTLYNGGAGREIF